jgi:hypothetical protein
LRITQPEQLVETKLTEMGEGLERISEPFYNGRIGITLGNCFLADEAFDQSRISSPVDQAGLPGAVEEQTGKSVPWKFL